MPFRSSWLTTTKTEQERNLNSLLFMVPATGFSYIPTFVSELKNDKIPKSHMPGGGDRDKKGIANVRGPSWALVRGVSRLLCAMQCPIYVESKMYSRIHKDLHCDRTFNNKKMYICQEWDSNPRTLSGSDPRSDCVDHLHTLTSCK